MPDNSDHLKFDDLKKEPEQNKSNKSPKSKEWNLAKGTVLEWALLKQLAAGFVRSGGDVDSYRFEWLADPRAEMRVLRGLGPWSRSWRTTSSH
jgi:hypothetical protein